jgi:hypothetical protein
VGTATAGVALAALACAVRLFSSVFKCALMVMRRLFIGVQTSGDKGWCSQMVHCSGSAAWPEAGLGLSLTCRRKRVNSHLSHIEVSQHGSLTAFTATRLHRPQRSLAGISSGSRVLWLLADVQVLETGSCVHGEIVLVFIELSSHVGGGMVLGSISVRFCAR